jgi:raffinose/stachyose/melibiose transport system permease protein
MTDSIKASSRLLKWLLALLMAAFALAQLFPLFWLINFSLVKSGEFFGSSFLKWPKEIQWKNYVDAFTYGSVPKYMFNSLFITMTSVALTAILSLMMGFAFTRMKWRLRTPVLNLILVGMIIPIHATLLPNFILFNEINLLDDPLALILPYTAINIPVSMFIITGFLETIPRAMEESAVIDGAGVFSIIYRIIMPMTKPALATVSVLNFISCWNEFIMANTFMVSDRWKTLPFSIIKFTGQYSSNYGAQFAVMTLIAVPSILIYLIFTESLTKGITAGAVKG